MYFWQIRDSKTRFLSTDISRLGLNLPRLSIFDRPFATPSCIKLNHVVIIRSIKDIIPTPNMSYNVPQMLHRNMSTLS